MALRAAGATAVLVDRDYQAGWDLLDRSLAIDLNSAHSWSMRGWITRNQADRPTMPAANSEHPAAGASGPEYATIPIRG